MVTAEGSIVDAKTSTVATRLDQELLAKLPTRRDAFYDLALTTPGMFTGSGAPAETTEFQSPTAYGSATNENVFLINGVNATSPRAGSFGSLVNVNYDTVEEVRVVARTEVVVRGTVRGEDGKPLASYVTATSRKDGSAAGSASSDASGVFAVKVPSGESVDRYLGVEVSLQVVLALRDPVVGMRRRQRQHRVSGLPAARHAYEQGFGALQRDLAAAELVYEIQAEIDRGIDATAA